MDSTELHRVHKYRNKEQVQEKGTAEQQLVIVFSFIHRKYGIFQHSL